MDASARPRWPLYVGCGCGLLLGCLGIFSGLGYAGVERFGLTFGAAMRNVCYASDVVNDPDPATRMQTISMYLESRVLNPQVKAMLTVMATMPPEERKKILQAASQEAGLSKCPVIEVY